MIRAAMLRCATLRSLWLASAAAMIIPALLTSVTATQIRMNLSSGRTGAFTDSSHLGLDETHLLLPLAMLIGVLIANQELSTAPPQRGSGRQATTTALVVPRRGHLAVLEALLSGTWAWLAGLVATGLAMTVARLLLDAPQWTGDPLSRLLGMASAWAVMAVVSHALTHLCRAAIVPFLVLLLLTTMVPAWALFERMGLWPYLLPDAAGIALFHPQLLDTPPAPWVACVMLGTWAVLAIAASAASRSRWPA